MKKYLFGLIALAGIVIFSAFTLDGNDNKNTELYYFFEVVDGVVNPLDPLNEEPMTIQDFELVNPVSCPEGSDEDCIRAWEEENIPTATGQADHTIQKDL